jgi:hypothetical protein
MSVISQCCNGGKNFQIVTDEVLFCSSECEKKHDIFYVGKEVVSMAAPVQVSYLTPEELEKYRNNTKNLIQKRKPRRVADWRWPQNRRKNG